MQVNFWSLTRLAKAVLRGMIRARAGRIVAIGSVAALQGNPGNAAYAASKGALLSYCRTLGDRDRQARRHRQLDRAGLHRHRHDGALREPTAPRWKSRSRPAASPEPEEIAGLAAFLMSPPAAYITGAVLPVDGGLTAMIGVHR